jgi:hypothetical protein
MKERNVIPLRPKRKKERRDVPTPERVQTTFEKVADRYFTLRPVAQNVEDHLVKNAGDDLAKIGDSGHFLHHLRLLDLYYEDFAHWAHLPVPDRGTEYTFHFAADPDMDRHRMLVGYLDYVEELMTKYRD